MNNSAPFVVWYISLSIDGAWYVNRNWNDRIEKTHKVPTQGRAEAIVEFMSGRRDISPLATQERNSKACIREL